MSNYPASTTSVSLGAIVTLDGYHPEPLTAAQAVDLLGDDGFLTTTVSLDMDVFAEMRTDDKAFDANEDRYTHLAALQMLDGDAYDASYRVLFFDPATNLVYIQVSNGLAEHARSEGFDLSDPEDRAAFVIECDAAARSNA